MAGFDQGTFFAPGARVTLTVLENEAAAVLTAAIGKDVLNAIPDLAMVLNDKRQIVMANDACLAALGADSVATLIGQRPGEALRCIHAEDGPQGCGTSVSCRQCGAVKAILGCLNNQQPMQYECQITSQEPNGEKSMEFLARANYVRVGEYPLVLLVLRDISAEKRKEALERLFFHDVLNSVGGIIGLAEMIASDDRQSSNDDLRLIHHLAENVAEEISAHRNLIQAENGTLHLEPTNVSLQALLSEIAEGLAYHPISQGMTIEADAPPNFTLRTDRVLLRRIVGNLAKNALEGSQLGSTVKLTAVAAGEGAVIHVSNPGVIPVAVQTQLFNRSFSSKGESGRGLGTYSIKLFAERYLKGKVSFRSSEAEGTVFSVELPGLGEG